MDKLDLTRELGTLYRPPRTRSVLVDVPRLAYLMIDGAGDPNTAPAYLEAIEALYSTSYTLKFAVKQGHPPIDYKVMPLEGLWWADDPSDFIRQKKDNYQWTLMIVQPEIVTADLVAAAIRQVAEKKDPPALGAIRFEHLEEGSCAQTMYIGPYADEGPTIASLHSFITEQGLALRGKHHEIYLGDPRRTAPERLKTIIRQPVS